ncbi:hypothetical protein D3C86_1287230 [compost metagenome]
MATSHCGMEKLRNCQLISLQSPSGKKSQGTHLSRGAQLGKSTKPSHTLKGEGFTW